MDSQLAKRRWAMRTEFGEEANALSAAVQAARGEGKSLLDLTISNPTRCGFEYDTNSILQALASVEAMRYDADPLGMLVARQGIVDSYYRPRGIAADPHRMLLTASTSEAYGYLLRLLCDAGDEILVPQPSYPLFDLLARLHDVRLVSYPLLRHDAWRIDLLALRQAIGPRTRAIVLVHPNNPTGHGVADDERMAAAALAVEFGLALIVDEVFLDYPVELKAPLRSFASDLWPVPTFVLSGLSKVLALPQMKLAWMLVLGPDGACEEAMHRLEFIADTFLSVGAPVQHAVADWMKSGGKLQGEIVKRTRQNLLSLDKALDGQLFCSRLPVQAGWSVLLRVPATLGDEELALLLLREQRLVVHPGSFYGLPPRGWLVLSLLGSTGMFQGGITRLVTCISVENNGVS